MNLDILAIGAHPDDVELSCSGTLMKHIALGYTIGILDLTKGELGSRGNGDLRMKEAKASQELMGAVFRGNCDLGDGFFTKEKESLLSIVTYIRLLQPKIVLANAIKDRHPDHARAAELVSRACFLAGLVKIKTESPIDGSQQEKWRPQAVYHYIQDEQLIPDFVVDISKYIDKKMEAIYCFKSQFYEAASKEYSDEPKTPISGKDFMDFMKAKGRVFGRSIGADFAEGFNVQKIPGVEDLFKLQ